MIENDFELPCPQEEGKPCSTPAQILKEVLRLTKVPKGDRNALAIIQGLTIKRMKDLKYGKALTTAAEKLFRNADDADSADGHSKHSSPVSRLLSLAAPVELFHTPDSTAYALVDQLKTYSLGGEEFEGWLRHEFYTRYQGAPPADAMANAIETLKSKAQFEGPEIPVYVRLAEWNGAIYLDLGDAEWRVVRIDHDGWTIVKPSPVRFRRPVGMLPLPVPEQGGSIDSLKPLLNLSEDDWILFVAWLLGAFRPRGPYPVLEIHGQQGSAKSTTSLMIRKLVDPSVAPLRSLPNDQRDLVIGAKNGWVLAFDNASHISPDLSDALCRVSDKGGLSTRTLYKNDSETLFNDQRPVLLNGIEDLADRGDLLDRMVRLELEPIPPERRLSDTELESTFERERPKVLGALLNAVSAALRHFETTRLQSLPRMADFARWVTAAESSLGWAPGTFLGAYERNRDLAHRTAIEGSPFGEMILELAERGWEGSATELLVELRQRSGDDFSARYLPRTANSLSGKLRRLAPNFLGLGTKIEFIRQGHQGSRHVRLSKNIVSIVSTSASEAA